MMDGADDMSSCPIRSILLSNFMFFTNTANMISLKKNHVAHCVSYNIYNFCFLLVDRLLCHLQCSDLILEAKLFDANLIHWVDANLVYRANTRFIYTMADWYVVSLIWKGLYLGRHIALFFNIITFSIYTLLPAMLKVLNTTFKEALSLDRLKSLSLAFFGGDQGWFYCINLFGLCVEMVDLYFFHSNKSLKDVCRLNA